MSIEQMRQAVLGAYTGARWADKVRRMSDAQIQAIYFRLLNQNQI